MVQSKIKEIAEKSLPEFAYMFDDWSRWNIQQDIETLPVFVHLLPVSGQFNIKNGIIRDYPNCMLAFLDKAELDFDGEDNEITVERMKKAAYKFINDVNKSGIFEPVSDFTYRVVYDSGDVNTTGIIIDVQLKEIQGVCVR